MLKIQQFHLIYWKLDDSLILSWYQHRSFPGFKSESLKIINVFIILALPTTPVLLIWNWNRQNSTTSSILSLKMSSYFFVWNWDILLKIRQLHHISFDNQSCCSFNYAHWPLPTYHSFYIPLDSSPSCFFFYTSQHLHLGLFI